MNDQRKINITPDPSILLALTNTPLEPLDALCELIDNGIDAFRSAKLAGTPVENPWIQITIPNASEVAKGGGRIVIADNGVGLDEETLAKALTAGYSSKNQYDSLGMFGMGFNIASGKLGMKTIVTSTKSSDDFAIRTEIDLVTLVKQKTFDLDTLRVEKPNDLASGTIIEISGWWPEGSQNSGFVKKLASISKPKLIEQIGRRYASILRKTDAERMTIRVNGDAVRSFEHCVWSESRFVERQGWGKIPSKITFDKVLNAQRHCIQDSVLIAADASECEHCGGSEFRTIEERVRGWVGIQRFDDSDRFGIDVIRNGRAILIGEKDAFFSLSDDFGSRAKEYPVDSVYGRIVGEINIDHVPVDFTKQDFQRASESWKRALEFIRGESLLESNWPSGYKNESPVGKLFKGYRKVRRPGTEDLYMGVYDEVQKKAQRVPRAIEREYFEKFQQRLPGYFDDLEWYKLVEDANRPSIKGLTPCPTCAFQNSDTDEECLECGKILRAKPCVSCSKAIVESAVSCPLCGESQIPEVKEPWICGVCAEVNNIDDDACSKCHSLRGTKNPMDIESLKARSRQEPYLCFSQKTFALSSNLTSNPLSANVYVLENGNLDLKWGGPSIPIVVFKETLGTLNIFLDLAHEMFATFGMDPKVPIAVESANYIYQLMPGNQNLNVSTISGIIIGELWGESVSAGFEDLKTDIENLFSSISQQLMQIEEVSDFANDLTKHEESELAGNLIKVGKLSELEKYKSNGFYLAYLSPRVIVRFFEKFGPTWFGIVWSEQLPEGELDAVVQTRTQRYEMYLRALSDCASYFTHPSKDQYEMKRTRASVEFLKEKLR